jgi:uncharacterized protein
MRTIILDKLESLEREFDVKILLACESGSRAWGFASPDSNYEVRFIYVHKKDFYLSIDERRDVLEVPIDAVLDMAGWELKKTLRLFRKSNPPLYEWLQSPLVYSADQAFLQEMQTLMPMYGSPRAAMLYYLGIAKGVLAQNLISSFVPIKRYFYALRPLLACKWIAETGAAPPMAFSVLRLLLDKDLHDIVDALLLQKASMGEKYTIPAIPALTAYVEREIAWCEQALPPKRQDEPDSELLHQIFRKNLL